MGRILFAAIILGAPIGWATSSLAEGALAVGMPEGNPNNGFKRSVRVNNPDAAAEALKSCRASRTPKVGAACVVIGTFSDQCVAIAVNGDPDPAPVSAAGWAIAPDAAKATKRAEAQCEAMRKGRGKACVLDGSPGLFCDGSAK
jgi:uncharacterized protein DUF4189